MKRIKIILLILVFLTPYVCEGKIIIIIHPSSPRETITKQEIRNIFLGEKYNWEDGSRIKIADNLDKHTAELFYAQFVGKEISYVKKNWIRKMLHGSMIPPESFGSNQELIDFVAAQKKAIGFVSEENVPTGVKELRIVN